MNTFDHNTLVEITFFAYSAIFATYTFFNPWSNYSNFFPLKSSTLSGNILPFGSTKLFTVSTASLTPFTLLAFHCSPWEWTISSQNRVHFPSTTFLSILHGISLSEMTPSLFFLPLSSFFTFFLLSGKSTLSVL